MDQVLIVEDDKKVAMALTQRLNRAGFDVLHARDALEGVALAVKHLPAVIVLDVGMPAGGGFSVIERLENLPSTASIPVIILTANRDLRLRVRAEELGVVAYFEKPYEADRLLSAVRTAADRNTVRST